jgi:hypothetical protein
LDENLSFIFGSNKLHIFLELLTTGLERKDRATLPKNVTRRNKSMMLSKLYSSKEIKVSVLFILIVYINSVSQISLASEVQHLAGQAATT